MLLVVVFFLAIIDAFMLYSLKTGVVADRKLPERLSNGDLNQIHIEVSNQYPFAVKVNIIDEIPVQFQIRDFLHKIRIAAHGNAQLNYELRPTERGEYSFAKLNVYVLSPITLISRRYIFAENVTLPTYPSFIQLRKYDLLAFSNKLSENGIKRIRRLGHTMEFEQIKEYVQGDDIRTINWKASSKRNLLMVNQFRKRNRSRYIRLLIQEEPCKCPFRVSVCSIMQLIRRWQFPIL